MHEKWQLACLLMRVCTYAVPTVLYAVLALVVVVRLTNCMPRMPQTDQRSQEPAQPRIVSGKRADSPALNFGPPSNARQEQPRCRFNNSTSRPVRAIEWEISCCTSIRDTW